MTDDIVKRLNHHARLQSDPYEVWPVDEEDLREASRTILALRRDLEASRAEVAALGSALQTFTADVITMCDAGHPISARNVAMEVRKIVLSDHGKTTPEPPAAP